jgi:hypothetical protein
MKKPKKINIRVLLEDITYEIDGEINSVINKLQELKNYYQSSYDQLDISLDCRYYSRDSASPIAELSGIRLETDEEYAVRMGKEKEYKEAQKQKELAELEHLRTKYKDK